MAKKHRTRRRAKSRKAMRPKLKAATINSIVQIIFFSLSALVMISFARHGAILLGINNFLIEYFGWTTVFLPFVFVSFAFLVSKFRNPLAEPNVIVGIIIFFISMAGLTKAGKTGTAEWDGLANLISPWGSAIVYLGTSIVGLIILFNTSLDAVWNQLMSSYKKYGVRGNTAIQRNSKFVKGPLLGKGEMKVIGGNDNNVSAAQNSVKPQLKLNFGKTIDKSPLEEKLVTNVPGEDKLWKYPPIDLLSAMETGKADRGDIKNNAATIEQTLDSFGVSARVVEVNLGPAVTQYAMEVALGTKLSKITALERDMALALAAPTGTIRIEAPIPGRSLVGIELPNRAPEFVGLKKMMTSDVMKNSKSKLSVALGLDVSGKPVIADLGRMPHVLIAGQTGSGKSVAVNTFLCSILMRSSPSEVKFIMVDPKRVELTGYNGIPHLLSPVITEPDKVVSALRWLQAEMDRRYKQFAQAGVRNIEAFNEMSGFQALPYILLFIDELADIMLFSPVEVEDAITRIAQMSRATGIHMVLSTQRPSVDVITGLIKANIPSRIAFAVSSQVDSRVVLDTQGAEKLLGRGDMLYLPPDQAKPMRIQGAFLSDKDINALVGFLKNQGVVPQYTEEVTSMPKPGTTHVPGVSGAEGFDENFIKAVQEVVQYDRASASLLQRKLSIGYARAARILDQLEQAGVIGPADGSKARDVLIKNPDDVFSKSTQE
jgi:DNA segregation ATPase FtsK/SpoIIIE, S-DNA-T family